MKALVHLIVLIIPFYGLTQVGVGTTEPKAQLDILASNSENPDIIDGILIPRVEKFPASNPSSDQHGMMVFLYAGYNDFSPGFYYWNHPKNTWTSVSAGADLSNFYEEGTTSSPDNIDKPIFRKGNVGIGIEETTAKLQIAITTEEDILIKKGLEIDNNNSATNSLTTYGIINTNRSATNGTKYGIKTNVAGDGSGIHYGIHNVTTQNTGTNDIYGLYNKVGRTYGASSDNFGIYTEIGTSTGHGNIYGIYSIANGDNNANVFAGYFAGRLGIGLTPAEEYILPATRGEESQILSTDGNGEVNWNYPNIFNYSSTGASSGNYIIQDEVYSLRINSPISTITIPDASENRGRILVLIGWSGIGTKNFNFLNGDTLFDLETNSNITSISSKERIVIQSIGTRWLVLSN